MHDRLLLMVERTWQVYLILPVQTAIGSICQSSSPIVLVCNLYDTSSYLCVSVHDHILDLGHGGVQCKVNGVNGSFADSHTLLSVNVANVDVCNDLLTKKYNKWHLLSFSFISKPYVYCNLSFQSYCMYKTGPKGVDLRRKSILTLGSQVQ